MRSSSRAALCVRALTLALLPGAAAQPAGTAAENTPGPRAQTSPGTGACETHGTVTEPRTHPPYTPATATAAPSPVPAGAGFGRIAT